jgi:predicted transcriptional regulator
MEIRLPPDQEAQLAAVAAEAGRSPSEVVQEALTQWFAREPNGRQKKTAPAEAAARLRELRKGNRLPDGDTIKDLINYGRA